MIRVTHKILGTVLSLILIGMAFIFFSINISNKSVTTGFARVSDKNLKSNADVYRDEHKIPHIIASNEHDLFFTLGYTHAQDRMWQMDFLRRSASGRLSEITGKENLEIDKFLRSLGLKDIAVKIYASSNKKSRAILEAYSEGVNCFIENNQKNLSFEFGALDYKPEKWSPVDCIMIGRGMAFQLCLGFWGDLAIGEIAEKVGVRKALDLIPSYPDTGPFIIEDSIQKNAASFEPRAILPADYKTALMESLNPDLMKIRAALGINGSSLGSNSWAMKKDKSGKSGAILANDPHLMINMPPVWYQVHLTAPGLNTTGMTVPGIPLPLIGRNDHIVWGITNMMIDDCDLFIEKLDSTNKDFYIRPGGKKAKFIYKVDTIKIRNEANYIYYQRFTDRSVVISDFHIYKHPERLLDYKDKNFRNHFLEKYCLTYSWTGSIPSDEVFSLYKLNISRNWKDFENAVSSWNVPGQNFTYADENGNIGIIPSGIVPVRGPECNPNLPNPGWIDGTSWKGYLPSESFRSVYNPVRKYVLSANNKTSKHSGFHITSYWEPSSRAERIVELLNQYDTYTARDAQLMQIDVYSSYARHIIQKIIPILESNKKYMTELDKKALNRIKSWDFIMNAASPSAAIFNVFLEKALYNTFRDDMGDRLYREYSIISNLPFRKFYEIVDSVQCQWFDDATTPRREYGDEIISRSFRNAVEYLKNHFETDDISRWHWGDLHSVTLNHPFSEKIFLKPAVTLGPFPVGGNLTTLNNTEWRIFKPFDMVLGASVRFIADMQDTVIYTNLPGGSSGDSQSPNYGDQVQLWLNGGYVKMPVSKNPSSYYRLSMKLGPD